MGKGLLFFCCACCISVLTIINLSIGPVINGVVGDDIISQKSWGIVNCQKLKDDYDDIDPQTDEGKKNYETQIDYCTRIKGMHDMEYTAFIFDIVIGFVCGLIGLLHLFDLKKDFVSNTGLIGLICGIVGFVLTFVYVIFNGLVFTGQYTGEIERDGDGAYAERTSTGANTFKCLYSDDSGDYFGGYAKFSDLNKKQYNYKHEFYSSDIKNNGCENDNYYQSCTDTVPNPEFTTSSVNANCKFLYVPANDEVTNKDKFDRFLTALILSLIVCLANIGLALFGFLLFRTPGDF